MQERIFPPSHITNFGNNIVTQCNIEVYSPNLKSSRGPVVIAPGFGSNAETMQLLGYELALAGFTAYCPDMIVGNEPRKFGILPDVDRAKQEALLGAIMFAEHEEVRNKLDVIAHSKGAIDVVMLAQRYPHHFHNLILVAPGGVHPGRGFFAVLSNLFMGDSKDHEHKRQLAQSNQEAADLIRVNSEIDKAYRRSKVRVFLESLTSVTVSIDQYFPYLQRNGVRIVIIAQTEDAFFSPYYLNPQGNQMAGVERLVVLPGIHGAMKFIPESSRRVIDVLKSMTND